MGNRFLYEDSRRLAERVRNELELITAVARKANLKPTQ
jgi:hypothetical protein